MCSYVSYFLGPLNSTYKNIFIKICLFLYVIFPPMSKRQHAWFSSFSHSSGNNSLSSSGWKTVTNPRPSRFHSSVTAAWIFQIPVEQPNHHTKQGVNNRGNIWASYRTLPWHAHVMLNYGLFESWFVVLAMNCPANDQYPLFLFFFSCFCQLIFQGRQLGETSQFVNHWNLTGLWLANKP